MSWPPSSEPSQDDATLAALWQRLSALEAGPDMRMDPIRRLTTGRLLRQAQTAPSPLRETLVARVTHHLTLLEQWVKDHRASAPHAHHGKPLNRQGHRPGLSHALVDGAPAKGAELASLGPMRQLHARLKITQQLRHTLAQPLHHAGPLHSERLVQQALARLSQEAPAYLHRLLSYLDALAMLEDARAVPRPASPKNSARSKPRDRVKAASTTKR